MDRDEKGLYLPGCAPGPGRPKGSRSKLSEAFLKAFADDFGEHGVDVIEQLRAEQPHTYVNAIGKLMPKLMELSGPDGDSIPLNGVVKFIKAEDDEEKG